MLYVLNRLFEEGDLWERHRSVASVGGSASKGVSDGTKGVEGHSRSLRHPLHVEASGGEQPLVCLLCMLIGM